jgi:hypothetical protein
MTLLFVDTACQYMSFWHRNESFVILFPNVGLLQGRQDMGVGSKNIPPS